MRRSLGRVQLVVFGGHNARNTNRSSTDAQAQRQHSVQIPKLTCLRFSFLAVVSSVSSRTKLRARCALEPKPPSTSPPCLSTSLLKFWSWQAYVIPSLVAAQPYLNLVS
jgi:hypothetical protein